MIVRFAGALILAVCVACPVAALAQGPAPVGVDEVIREPMRQTVPVLGQIVARQRGEVAARVQGAVKEVDVDVGDRVEAGTLLAVIDDAWLKLAVSLREAAHEEAEATVGSAEANERIARQAFDRLDGLKGSAAFSAARYEDAQQELLRATAALAAARSRLASAVAELEVARLDLKYSEIHAPYAGVIVGRHAQPGAYLTVGSPVVTMIDDTSLEIEADVPASQSGGLAVGETVRAVRSGGGEAEAKVRAIIPDENPMTRTRAVRLTARFDDGGRPVAAGESVTVHVPVAAERMVTTVHKDAIVQQATGPVVYLVADGAAEARQVSLGLAVGERFEVTSGLEPGDVVVVRGNERLQPGQKVSF